MAPVLCHATGYGVCRPYPAGRTRNSRAAVVVGFIDYKRMEDWIAFALDLVSCVKSGNFLVRRDPIGR